MLAATIFRGPISRRYVLTAMVGVAAAPLLAQAGEARPAMVVHRDPYCSCCEKWVAHVGANGFEAKVVVAADMDAVKKRLRVPGSLVSCHTAEVGGYVIEGHVPAKAIARLLREKPQAIGLAAPGMPQGSPGMEGGVAEIFDVILFGPQGEKSYGRYRGGDLV
ncbi:MAG: DUF411 domain-containing protein [Rhodoblastus sp.]